MAPPSWMRDTVRDVAFRSARTDAEDLRDGERIEHGADLVLLDDPEAVGLVEVRCQLGQELRWRDADRNDEAGFAQDVLLDAPTDFDRVAVVFG